VSAAVPEASLMTDEYLASAELVAVRASRWRLLFEDVDSGTFHWQLWTSFWAAFVSTVRWKKGCSLGVEKAGSVS
jgi:hypothetical protein